MALVAKPRTTFYDADADDRGRLVVKHTFLDFVEADDDDTGFSLFPPRARTDPMHARGSVGADVEAYHPGSPTDVTPQVSDDEGQVEQRGGSSGSTSTGSTQETSTLTSRSGTMGEPPLCHARQPRMSTLMLRNLPKDYTQDMLLWMLDSEGFHGSYDFVYMPRDFARGNGLGYAFVNLVDPGLVEKFQRTFDGYSRWSVRSNKVCQVSCSSHDHGLKKNIKRYRNSTIMHSSVPDEWKPWIFADGARVPFPAPTRRLTQPSKASRKSAH